MAELPPPSKPSGLKPPSKIGRPCASNLPKPAVPPQTPKMNGASGSVRKLSDDLIKTRINEEVEENDDFTSDFFARRYSFDRKSSIGGLSSNDSLWGEISLARRLSEAGVRRTSDNSVILTEDTDSFIVGDRVWVGGTKPGRIAYIGETQFAPGDWAGIVLDEPIGKNDGAVGNTRYFQCEAKKGIFSKLGRLTRVPLALPEPPAQTPVPSTPLASPPSSIRGSIASRSPPPSSVASTPAYAPTGELKIGERVIVMSQQGSKAGILRFKGTTGFATGEWCGVELDDPLGKNDGTVDGVRYFTCEAKFGLFAPAHKVSRSPAKNRRPSCQVHHNATSIRRASSKESLTGSIASVASSVRTNNTSYTARKALIRPLTSPTTPKPSAQDLVKCKQDQINQLLKEKQMDRTALTNAAQQADDLERKLGVLQTDYDKVCASMTELKIRNDVAAMEAIEMKTQKDRLKATVDELQAQLEDVQFRAEEETIIKSDIQGINQKNEEKIRELEQLLLIEQTKNESLLEDAEQVKEALKKVDALQTELKYAISTKEEMEKTLKQELIDTIDRANRMEQSYNKAQDDLDKIVSDSETNKSNHLECSSHESEKLKNEIESLKTQNKEIQNLVVKLETGRSELLKTVESKNEEVAWLNQEVSALQKKSTEVENEKQNISLKLESLMKDLHNLETQYDSKCKEYSEASATLETLNVNLQETQRSLANQLELTDNLKKEIENNKSSSSSQMDEMSKVLEIEVLKVKDELSQSVEILKNRETELEKARTICGELTAKISVAQADCNKLMEDVKEKDSKCEELQLLIDEKEKSINQLKETVSSAHGNSSKIIEELNAKIKDFTGNFEKERHELSKTVDDQAKLILEKDRVIEGLNSKSVCLETDIKSLGSSKAALEEELNQAKKQLLSETENVEQLKVQLRSKESDVSAKTEEIYELMKSTQELREGKSTLEDSLSALKSNLQKLELELGDSQRRLADATDRCEQLSSQKTKLENDMAQMINSSSDSSSQLTRINAELNEKLKELDELKLSSSEAAREHKNREQELSQQLDSIRLSSEELRKELHTQKELNEVQSNLIQSKLKVNIAELESKLEESVATHATTKQQKDALNERMLHLEQSLKDVSCKFEESVKCKEDAMKNLEETKKLVEAGEINKSNQSKEIDTLVSKLSTLEHDFKIISEEKLQLSEKLKGFEVASSESSLGFTKLKEENASLLAKLDVLLNTTSNEMSVLKKFVDEKDDIIKKQLSTIEELKTKLGAADELVVNANKEIEGKIEELSVFKTSLKDTEGVRQNIIKEKEALSAENEKLQIQTSELTDRLKSSEEKESQLRKEIDVMGQRLQNLESSLGASSKSVDALKASQREKESLLSDIQQSSAVKEAELSARIEAMNKQLSELNIVLEMTQEEHDNEVDKIKQKENVLANDLKKKEEDLIEASEKLAKYENELKMVRANSSEASKTLSEEVETLKKMSETTIISLNDKLKEQEKEMKVKCDNEIKLEAQVKSMAGELGVLKKQNDDLANAKLNNESELAELSNQRRKATEEKVKLEKELEESQAQALRFKQQLETEVSNRAASSTDLAKLESQLNLIKQEKLSVDEKLKSTMDELSRMKSKSETPRKAAAPDENEAMKSEEDAALNNWLEEKELADSQINFLNAIIVDMKKKNDDLQAQLAEFGTNGVQLSPSKVAKEVAPRLFCDICDMFDLHDTEDCPQQASDSPPPSPRPHRIPGTRKLEERPYCDICEVFGHDSSECDDAETF